MTTEAKHRSRSRSRSRERADPLKLANALDEKISETYISISHHGSIAAYAEQLSRLCAEEKIFKATHQQKLDEIDALKLKQAHNDHKLGLHCLETASHILGMVQHILDADGGFVLYACKGFPTDFAKCVIGEGNDAADVLYNDVVTLYNANCSEAQVDVRTYGRGTSAGYKCDETVLEALSYYSPEVCIDGRWLKLYLQNEGDTLDILIQRMNICDEKGTVEDQSEFTDILEEDGEHKVEMEEYGDAEGYITGKMLLIRAKL